MAKLNSTNPANGNQLGSVSISSKVQVEAAVAKAREAFPAWSQTTLKQRAQILSKVATLLKKDQTRLAELISKEVGKPLVEANDEISSSIDFIDSIVETGLESLRDEVIVPKLSQDVLKQMVKKGVEDALDYLTKKKAKQISVLRYAPMGVVAVIKPWNFPIDVTMWSLAPALLAGNTVVFKPSENTPLISQELVKLIYLAGVPKEVLRVVQGRSQVGAMLVDSDVDMVSFTGSTEVGKEVYQKCAEKMIKCVLEMGGSSAAIVAADADLDLAVNSIVWGRFYNCGQSCDAIKRVFVETKVADKFNKKLVKAVGKLRVGDPLDKDIDIGPLVSEKQFKTLQRQVTQGVVQGGRIIAGGRPMREEPFASGYFHEPTVMIHVNSKNVIMREEVFGPILPVAEVSSFNSALRQANDSSYGLSAAIFTQNKSDMAKALNKLEVGMIYFNESVAGNADNPWCGVKGSALGVERGKHGLWEFTHKKHLYADNSKDSNKDYWFPY